jgi:hypothetical protein
MVNYMNILYAALCVLGLITIVLLALYCCNHADFFTNTNGYGKDWPSPLYFPKQLQSVPGNCSPYMGCFYPSSKSNPINLRTGTRDPEPQEDDIWCEKSWRDCAAYRSCVDGKCIPKKYPNVR